MTEKDDGGLLNEDKAKGVQVKNYTLLAMDDSAVPQKVCPKGHIVQWGNPETGITVTLLQRINVEARTTEPLCIVCGVPGEDIDNGTTEGDEASNG